MAPKKAPRKGLAAAKAAKKADEGPGLGEKALPGIIFVVGIMLIMGITRFHVASLSRAPLSEVMEDSKFGAPAHGLACAARRRTPLPALRACLPPSLRLHGWPSRLQHAAHTSSCLPWAPSLLGQHLF
jgi:hypothetical protein